MRCSYYRKHKKIINTETEEDSANYRILLDLKNHNWLLKKLQWQMDNKHLKNDSQKSKMSEIINIDDLEYQIIEVDETQETEDDNTSTLPVSLPVQFFNKMSHGTFITKRDSHATSGYNIANLTPDPKDVEVAYNEITKELNKTILKSEPSVHSGLNESKSQLLTKLNNKQKNHNITAVRNINNSEDIGNNNLNKVPQMDIFITDNEKQKWIKHNLPLAAPPEREKYKVYENKALVKSGTNIKSGIFFISKDNCNAETQTDGVPSIDDSERNLINFIKLNNISVEQMKKIIGFIERKDAETITENDSNMNEIMRDQVLIILEACSFYNKELIALNSLRSENGSFPSSVDTYIKKLNIAYLRQAFETVLGPLFVELMKNCNEENIIDTNLPDVVPRIAEIRKRRVSVQVDPHSDSTNNEIPATVTQNVPMNKKPALRVRQKSRKQPQLTYPATRMPQLQQYPHVSEIVQAENNTYLNRHVPNRRNYNFNQQYQYTQTKTPHREIPVENPLPFYNTGPRMMQPYSMQFTREQLTEYRNVSNTWGHTQRYPNVAQNLRPYINEDPMSTRVLPTSGQRNYHHNQIQRNVVHNNNNNMPNYSGADWNM